MRLVGMVCGLVLLVCFVVVVGCFAPRSLFVLIWLVGCCVGFIVLLGFIVFGVLIWCVGCLFGY